MNSTDYRDESVLRELYIEKELTTTEIADRFGVSAKTISNWLNKLGINTGGRGCGVPYDVSIYTGYNGYVRVENGYKNKKDRFALHRLIAVAEYGFKEVADKEVHHKNNCRWHNSPKNLEVISPEKHGRLHANERWENAV